MNEQPEAIQIANALELMPELIKATHFKAAAELRRLQDENFELAAGQCSEGGPWGDEGGTQYCKLKEELRRLHLVNQELLKILAYVEASDLGSMLCARARAAIQKAKGESNE